MKSIVLVSMLASSVSHADETIIVIDKAPDPTAARDRDRALGDAPFVTVIHPDDHPATASVADAVGEAVGAQTRSLGGLGAYESVTVRGATPGHTEVLIDGIPLARIAAVTTDLGRYALDAFDRVDLYRGAVPVELGGAGVGGALDLVTRLGRDDQGQRWRASLGYGSFGARHLRVHHGDRYGGWASSATLGYQGATGDYTYFSDNGTQLNPNDDTYRTRTNNAFDQIDLAARIGRPDGTTAYGLRAAAKDQGLPGSANQPTLKASLATLDVIADARGAVALLDDRLIAKQRGYAVVERQHLRDPWAELGLGNQARDYTTLSAGGATTWAAALDRHRLTAGLELRGDHFTDRSVAVPTGPMSPPTSPPPTTQIGTRLGGAALASFDLLVDPAARIVVTPAVRLDVVRTRPATAAMAPIRTDTVPSPRLSARVAIRDDVSVKASAGAYVRLPTLTELFGNHGTLVGTPGLRPETGRNGDAGVVYAPALPIAGGELDRVMVEAAGFATRIHDTILFVPLAGSTVFHAENIADARTYGGELVATARLHRVVTLTANYTHLVTVQLDPNAAFANKALPRQPGDVVYGRVDAVHDRLSAYFDVAYQASTFLDAANLEPLPARVLLGAGVHVALIADLGLAVTVANLANVRTEPIALVPPPRPDLAEVPTPLADYFGYPLPGRSYYLSLDWSYR